MKRSIMAASFLLCCMISFAGVPDALKVKTFTLSNGMEVWINEDHSQPKAFGAVVVKAGAKDCPGTGIAHYFEHMMFKGTDKIGTIDYEAEKPFLDSIAVLYDQLAEAPSDSVRRDIQMEINRLNIAACDYAIPSEFDNLITECGGSNLNAYTSQDVTVYHNQFVSAYFEQWAELNSERLISPVFRLFQSELETVYEEKNRSLNNEMSAFRELLTSKGFQGTPYSYPVLGTTENLKNPQLSLMAKFFDDYYVAGNMGLMLTGDIDAQQALPILEKTFGRIRPGVAPERAPINITPYSGREEVTALAKIPLVKMTSLCYSAPSNKNLESLPMCVLSFMLNNSEGTGMLDKLTTNKKLLAAICMYTSTTFNEAGLFSILIMPKLLFQRNKKAEALVKAVLDDIKSGNFDESFLESCKLSLKRLIVSNIESVEQRMEAMVDSYTQGLTWEENMEQIESIDSISKEEIVAIANKYITDDYLVITKKFGNPEKDNLQKPPYKKVTPKNTGATSAYAAAIKESAGQIVLPKVTVDFENGAEQSHPAGNVTVYSVRNDLNDVFNLTLSYPVGSYDFPNLDRVTSYLSLSGTDSMNYDEHRKALQEIGSSIGFSSDNQSFSIEISGFDDRFEETLALASDLINNPKCDKKQLSTIKQGEVAGKLTGRKDPSQLASCLLKYAIHHGNSPYLADKGKIDDSTLMNTYNEVLSYNCDVHYTGRLEHQALVNALEKKLDFSKSVKDQPFFKELPSDLSDKPEVYFVNRKNATQSIIYAIIPGDKMDDAGTRYLSYASNEAFGGGGSLSSILFQEIREFRSLSYSPYSKYFKPSYASRNEIPGYLQVHVSTQGDKTEEAMSVMDSLVNNAVFTPGRVGNTVKNIWCSSINDYPTFRYISSYIANQRHAGYESDPDALFYPILENMSAEDMQSFWSGHVTGRNFVWVVVGDAGKIDMEALKSHGEFHELKAKDIMK